MTKAKFDAKRVMNGTWGELWIDGILAAEVYKVQAKESYSRENVPICGSLTDGKKLTKIERTGSIGMHHVNTRMAGLIANRIPRRRGSCLYADIKNRRSRRTRR